MMLGRPKLKSELPCDTMPTALHFFPMPPTKMEDLPPLISTKCGDGTTECIKTMQSPRNAVEAKLLSRAEEMTRENTTVVFNIVRRNETYCCAPVVMNRRVVGTLIAVAPLNDESLRQMCCPKVLGKPQ